MSSGRCFHFPLKNKNKKWKEEQKKKKKNKKPNIWCELKGLFSSQSEPTWEKTLPAACWSADSYGMPVTTSFITLEHERQRGSISTRWPMHTNSSSRTKTWKVTFTDILFKLTELASLSVGCLITAWCESGFCFISYDVNEYLGILGTETQNT